MECGAVIACQLMVMQTNESLRVIPPIASAVAAMTALGISVWVALSQRRIQERQLQKDLFDKRYIVYLAVEEFLMYVLREDGSIDLLSDDVQKYRRAVEKADFLFDADVTDYMSHVQKVAFELYPIAVKRDHLAKMAQREPDVDVKVASTLVELSGTLSERREEVFRPYLRLNRPMLERSMKNTRLNGWQRLWVLVLLVLILPVLWFGYELWPTAASIPKSEIYKRMTPEEGRRLIDYYDVTFGGTTGVIPLISRLQHDKDFLAASPKDQRDYLSVVDPEFAKASSVDQDAYLANITGTKGEIVEIDGHTVQFVPRVSSEEENQTAGGFYRALHHILTLQRASLIGWSLALWLGPMAMLYVLGWGIGWVRRGFA